jgi:CRISPR system Cascade subunit CasC
MNIELHLVQNFAPSCLNRDDTNQPKDCEFGGVRRARISSQCIKRAMRLYFRENGACAIGSRTKRLKQILMERLKGTGSSEEELSGALDIFLETYYSQMDSKRPDETAVLLYIGEPEIREATECIKQLWSDLVPAVSATGTKAAAAKKKGDRRSLKADPDITRRLRAAGLSPDIGLFGRMLAELPGMNVDAAAQVAHAISTHRVDMDMDFYTAVDDLNPESETGAGMMGVTGFNSACFYRYALLDRAQLLDNLKDGNLTDEVTKAFLLASVHAIPTGKQNSMAAQNLPSFGMFVVRSSGAPCSLANAYAEPVHVIPGGDDDLIGRSVEALTGYWARMQRVYGSDGLLATPLFHDGRENRLRELASSDAGPVQAAVEAAMKAVGSAKGG